MSFRLVPRSETLNDLERRGRAHPRFFLFQTNDKERLAPLTCQEYSTVKHIKITE